MGAGATRSNQATSESELRIKYGVASVVSTETATAIGYRKSLVTFSDSPSDAMMKENSPICASPMPTLSDEPRSLPATNVPNVHATTFPKITTMEITTMGSAYFTA